MTIPSLNASIAIFAAASESSCCCPGSQLRKNEIAIEYGVSRAPVNEAIARLADEGLVDVFPQSGSFVAPIRPEDIRESLLIRTGLEVEVVRRAAQLADRDLLGQLDKNLEAQAAAVGANDMVRLDDLDEAFHATILLAVKLARRAAPARSDPRHTRPAPIPRAAGGGPAQSDLRRTSKNRRRNSHQRLRIGRGRYACAPRDGCAGNRA